jgi:hypothetical protein
MMMMIMMMMMMMMMIVMINDDAPLPSLLQVYPPSSGPSLAANPTILRTSPS